MANGSNGYAHPDVLVDRSWVAEHLHDPKVRIVEVDEDVLLYEQGHIPGAVKLDWLVDVQDPVERDFVDKNNWYACYSFWLFSYFGHKSARVMNGGRQKWVDEARELTREVPSYPRTEYRAQEPNAKIR